MDIRSDKISLQRIEQLGGVAKCFVFEGLEAALGRKKHENYRRKVTRSKRKFVQLRAMSPWKAVLAGQCK